jgi:hypothetical protein
MCPGMRHLVESPEDPLPVHLRNDWPLATSGHVAQQLLTMHINVHKPQGRRGRSLLVQRICHLVLSNASTVQQLCTRRHNRHISGGVRAALWSGGVETTIRYKNKRKTMGILRFTLFPFVFLPITCFAFV